MPAAAPTKTPTPSTKASGASGRASRAPSVTKSKAKGTGFGPSDPFVPHPQPSMTRHEFLAGLHDRLRPRTYLEIGIRDGMSLALARGKAIGVDPAFRIVRELDADLRLFRTTSDDFFARDDAMTHFGGTPVDLAFIDGMHLSEFAFRDFINVEKVMSAGGVIVFDDVLPRNPLEAARDRKTSLWAGDVYKAVEVLRRRRPDLLVVLVNTAPTGTAIVTRLDPRTERNHEIYESELPMFLAPDPQRPPDDFMNRSTAVNPRQLLELDVWQRLVLARQALEQDLAPVWQGVLALSEAPADRRAEDHG